MKRSAAPPSSKPKGCPAWMMTFGDCMSLLVCFFVMLIAFSDMESEKLSPMIGAMRGALGGVEQLEPFLIREDTPIVDADGLSQTPGEEQTLRFLTLEEMAEMVPQMIVEIRASSNTNPDGLPDRVLIRMIEDGLTIILQTKSLFIQGTADWENPKENRLWEGIAKLLAGHDNDILITAVLAQQTVVNSETSRSVWGLGVERAESVAGAMQTAMKADIQRFGTGVQIAGTDGTANTEAVLITILGERKVTDLRTIDKWPTGIWQ